MFPLHYIQKVIVDYAHSRYAPDPGGSSRILGADSDDLNKTRRSYIPRLASPEVCRRRSRSTGRGALAMTLWRHHIRLR